ncbi:hypothetical protein PoB_002435400 [Plakobranchus ocellatus]|uniref:Secreted protein n=1 Tax=Plakobranchus ocellatus TaxID=259542 RepID=A0AAV3ZTV8_9GAST|nr:hypothetical protein PoB_002435400 [Plakobranchus ocellatus]
MLLLLLLLLLVHHHCLATSFSTRSITAPITIVRTTCTTSNFPALAGHLLLGRRWTGNKRIGPVICSNFFVDGLSSNLSNYALLCSAPKARNRLVVNGLYAASKLPTSPPPSPLIIL